MKISRGKLELAQARAGLSRKEIAEESGVPFSTIENTFTRRRCSPVNACKIAKVLGIDVSEFVITEEDD